VFCSFAIQSEAFQRKVAQQATNYLSQELNAEVHIDNIRINGLHYVKAEGVYIEDQEGDTLLYANTVIANVKEYSIQNKLVVLNTVDLVDATVKLQKYKEQEKLNLQFLIEYFKRTEKKDEKTTPFKFLADDIRLTHVNFSYNDWNVAQKSYGIDYKHIGITDLNGVVKDLQNHQETTRFSLEKLTFNEKSGFVSENLSAFVLITPNLIEVKQLEILTPASDINANQITLSYHDYKDFRDFVNAVVMKGDIQSSQLNMKDLSYFAPVFKKMSNTVTLKGEVFGPVNELDLKHLFVGLTSNTFLSCNAEMKGLPYLDEALFYIDINEVQTYRKDLELIDFKSLGLKNDLELPEQLNSLGVVNLSGVIDGFYNDFKMNLDIASDIGAVEADLLCSIDEQNKLGYKGVLNTSMLALGDLSGMSDLGAISTNLKIDGKGTSLSDLNLFIEGEAPSLEFRGYHYKNIALKGDFKNSSFNGNVGMKDKNIDFSFDGIVDLNQKPVQFNFEADLQKVDLEALNLIQNRTNAIVSVNVDANGFGSNLDEFSGYVHFNDISYFENGKNYYFDSILFESQSNTRFHSIDVFAQFAELSMRGDYSLDSLPQSLYGLGAKILPSIFTEEERTEMANQYFDLNLKVNDLSMLTELFYPALSVSNETKMSCEYQSNDDLLELAFQSDYVKYNNIEFRGVQLDTTRKIAGFDPFYIFDLTIDTLIPVQGRFIENVEIQAKAYQDNVASAVLWGSPDSSYWGHIDVDGYVLSPHHFETEVLPSVFFAEKVGRWEIQRIANISIDTTAIKVDNLVAHNEYQTIRLNGKVSEKPIDQLNFELGSFELSNLNNVLNNGDSALMLEGVVNLSGFVSDVYNDLFFDAYSWVDDLTINKELVGDVELNSNWNEVENRIELLGNLKREDGIQDLELVQGYYYPKKEYDNLDMILAFQETNLAFVNVFLPSTLQHLKGKLKGELLVKGELKAPQLKGDLLLDSAEVTIEMLNTTYYTNGPIKIEEDLIGLEALTVKDKFGSEAILIGSFFHENFKNYSYDFFAFFDAPFLVMNTNYEQNNLYYGNAFATGDVSINYEKVLEITVNAKSEKGTNVTLPLYGSEEVVLEDFITFVDVNENEEEYEVDLDGVNLNLSLDITEDAEIQLVFDDVVGDAMRGTGSGHIDMYIDQFYDFYMFGNYTVKEGSYLFTLRDFINKKFNVKEGGTISWYGNPYDADVNLTAIYPLKASLYDIMPESERDLYRQKVAVDCEMNLTNSLFNPNIDFNVSLPRSDENAKSILANLVSTPTEMNRQVFSLLILNKFLPRVDAVSATANSGVLGATTSEMLSNQLSNMLSNFTDDFDVGFNYRPGDEISNNEVALALSTQLLNDKLTISTNLGVSSGTNGSSTEESTNNFIGDVDVEYQLNDKGNVRVHAFNKSNEFDISSADNSANTQGVGVFYQENFSTFKELWCKLRNVFKSNDKDCNIDE
jgi:hypothetical protein